VTEKFAYAKELRRMVSENRILGRIFVLKREEATGGWRKLYCEEIQMLCSSPYSIRVVKLGRMRKT
jgi:hypothetical protein